MSSKRLGGVIFLKINGDLQRAKGNFTYNLGKPVKEAVIGSDQKAQGFKETGQAAFIEGEITDAANLDLVALLSVVDATATLELANGKVIVLREAWYAGNGNGQTDEGNIAVRFEAEDGEEVR